MQVASSIEEKVIFTLSHPVFHNGTIFLSLPSNTGNELRAF